MVRRVSHDKYNFILSFSDDKLKYQTVMVRQAHHDSWNVILSLSKDDLFIKQLTNVGDQC